MIREATSGTTADATARANILLVDDTPANLVALSAILARPEYNLVKVSSGEDALRQLLRDEFALVLLDVMMPRMDGYAVAAAMKERARTRHVPIIFVTAIAREMNDVYRGYAAGGVDYVVKPLDPDVVKAKVAVFVELFRQRKEIERQDALIRDSERARHLETERAARIRAEAAERRYYDLINWVDHAVLWEYDAIAGKFSFVSQRSGQIFGFPPQQWVDDPSFFVNRIPPADRHLFQDLIENGALRGRDGRCEHRLERSDGSILWVHSGVNPRKDAADNVTLLWGLTLDITGFKTSEANQRFLAEASAALSESFDIASTIDKVTHLVVPAIADWCVVDMLVPGNAPRRISSTHRAPEKESLIRAIHQRYPIDEGRRSPVFHVIETGESIFWKAGPDATRNDDTPTREHLELFTDLGMESLLIVPLKAKDKPLGAISFVSVDPFRRFTETDVVLAKDLAWRISIAIENARLYDESKRATALREEVLGVVSHDLKTPLSAISLNAQILAKENAEPRAVAERIDRSVQKMTRLISDLLDMARVGAGELTLEITSRSAQSLIDDVIETVAPLAKEKGVRLRNDSPEEPVFVRCDGERALQALSNLVGNAVKFSPAGSEVTVGGRVRENEVLFCVADAGPGIAAESLAHLFEPFWQGAERRREGTGLGLAIARRMVEAQGGKIWAESKPGSGSSFYFTLPRGEPPHS